jgi:hypothetical protein
MLDYQQLYLAEFVCAKPQVCRQLDRMEPELGGGVVAIHVNMRRLIRLMAVEIESIGAGSERRRHARDVTDHRRLERGRVWQNRFYGLNA